jgi:hypothetical protein
MGGGYKGAAHDLYLKLRGKKCTGISRVEMETLLTHPAIAKDVRIPSKGSHIYKILNIFDKYGIKNPDDCDAGPEVKWAFCVGREISVVIKNGNWVKEHYVDDVVKYITACIEYGSD